MTTSVNPGFVLRIFAKSLLALSLASAGSSAHAVVCRVAVDGVSANTGAIWSAPKDLKGALVDATCTEIWVKQGVYRPSTPASIPPSDRLASFRITRDLGLYGGFAGSEATLDARDPQLNRTILSGDMAGDDINVDGNFIAETTADIVGINSSRVVYAGGPGSANITNVTVIDGFTITAGLSGLEQTLDLRRGAGMFCHASATASVCSPRLNAIEFRGNLAAFNGGAMSNFAQGTNSISSPTLTRVRFSGNSAANGGAMHNETRGPGNVSGSPNSSSPILVEVSFTGNNAQRGGAMYNLGAANHSSSSPVLTQVSFVGNTATGAAGFGGALFIECRGATGNRTSPVLNEVTFSGNTAGGNGGAMGIIASGPGGRCNPELNQVTMVGNNANSGGAISVQSPVAASTSFSLKHVILWGNSAMFGQQILIGHPTGNVVSIDTSVIEGGCVIGAGIALAIGADPPDCGSDNLADDPLLGPLQDNGGFTPTHLPGPASSAIDTGDNSTCGPLDQRGVARPQDGDGDGTAVCDIGAVEVQPDSVFANGFES